MFFSDFDYLSLSNKYIKKLIIFKNNNWERKREEEREQKGRERENVGFLEREALPSL